MQLKTVNPLDYVKANPGLFFNYDDRRMQELVTKVVTDALSVSACPIVVDSVGAWHVVASSKNWLGKTSENDILKMFNTLIPNPAAGRNASRSEVLLNVFATNVIVFVGGATILVKGRVDSEVFSETRSKYNGFNFVLFSER
ncbi:MAG TPA: hypothetical protein VLE50_00225 [Cellvibrio sp.]|nr:hypothetical protein [Cellvibrio sp.]